MLNYQRVGVSKDVDLFFHQKMAHMSQLSKQYQSLTRLDDRLIGVSKDVDLP